MNIFLLLSPDAIAALFFPFPFLFVSFSTFNFGTTIHENVIKFKVPLETGILENYQERQINKIATINERKIEC